VPGGKLLRITASVGVSTAAANQRLTHAELFAQADKALYGAKRGGRNRVDCFATT
jgi:diguanylate cyclase (GGDEF)-like protein